jgi:hypothetical protein
MSLCIAFTLLKKYGDSPFFIKQTIMKKIIILLAVFTSIASTAQSVGINADGSAANASAMLDVSSTTKGFLPPRMTYTERNLISLPERGLIIFCANCAGNRGQLQVFDGTDWTDMVGGIAKNLLPTLANTAAASSITGNTAICGGNVTNDGGNTIATVGVCWSINQNPTTNDSKTTQAGATGSFTSNLSTLSFNTTYYVRAYATNASGTSYGSQISFTTMAHDLGEIFQGGKIAYIDNTGQHGFIIAPDQNWNPNNNNQNPPGWWNGSYVLTNATGTAIGTGLTNTNLIVSVQGAGSYAAKLCADLVLGGYDDWFLPSRDELQKIGENRVALGEFSECGSMSMEPCSYWSSSEINNNDAYAYSFRSSNSFINGKGGWYRVRAIRYF